MAVSQVTIKCYQSKFQTSLLFLGEPCCSSLPMVHRTLVPSKIKQVSRLSLYIYKIITSSSSFNAIYVQTQNSIILHSKSAIPQSSVILLTYLSFRSSFVFFWPTLQPLLIQNQACSATELILQVCRHRGLAAG